MQLTLPRRVLAVQLGFIAIATAVSGWIAGVDGAGSALAGGATAWMPTMWFARQIERRDLPTRTAPQTALRAELGKWMMTVAGFVLALTLLPRILPGALFGTFAICQLAYVVSAAFGDEPAADVPDADDATDNR